MGIKIDKVAVLGSGVMGAQIAALFANAGIGVLLYDMDKSQVAASIENLKKISPKPLASLKTIDYIVACEYKNTHDLEEVKHCGLIIEAIVEKLEIKKKLFEQITPYLADHAILATNTSGLSINQLTEHLPEKYQGRFCGIHFFNPPRYMQLVELIANNKISSNILDGLETFLVTRLGKTVIRAKDTPNFIANRLGVFSLLITCIHAENFAIPLEVVDQLTGKSIGRPKSATFRTADIVGLDIFEHVVATMRDNCNDSWSSYYQLTSWIKHLIQKRSLGEKTKAGIYYKDRASNVLHVLDINNPQNFQYRPADKKYSNELKEILAKNSWQEKITAIKNSDHIEAKFLWACFRDVFHYAAVLLGDISDSVKDIDRAMRYGFGWKEGIFEIWQQAGWRQVAEWVNHDINQGLALSKQQLPTWVLNINEVYQAGKHYSASNNCLVHEARLPVYQRQLFPEKILNAVNPILDHRTTVYENDGVHLWCTDDKIGILSFKSKMCTIGMDVLLGIEKALEVASSELRAVIIWQEKDIFSAGADLEEFGYSIMMNGVSAVDEIISIGHRVIANKLKYSPIPVIAAIKGYVLGGGCEIMLHSARVVAAMESYIGLVEAGVGLLPGWGGSKEMAYRASLSSDHFKEFERRYRHLAMAEIAYSAAEAKEMGFLRESDIIIQNTNELLFVAKACAEYMLAVGYTPPIKPKNIKVLGDSTLATTKGMLINMLHGGQISDHDYKIATAIAEVMCGGEITPNSSVSEDWLLNIEKNKFKELAVTQKTADRIEHMLTTGKPLRN